MTVKRAVQQQYQSIVNLAAVHADALRLPNEGWLRTARKALGMSGAQLARRLGVTRARVAHAEHAELTGGVTLKSLQAAAEAMGFRFVYAIVPPRSVEDTIDSRARKKAAAIVEAASQHMALEGQGLPAEMNSEEIARLAREMAYEMPPDFWDDP